MDVPFFTYQGSKASIRKWILPHMPQEGDRYIEPFAGRANMFFLAKTHLNFKRWVLNDLHTYQFLIQLFTLKDEDLDCFPEQMTWDLYKEFKNKWEKDKTQSLLIEPGIAHLGHYRSGWMGKYSGTRKWNRDQYKERILKAHNLLQGQIAITGITWSSLPWDSFDSEDFVYFDPPYMNTEHRYYSDIDHEDFLRRVKTLKCKWLLSNSDNPFYRENLGDPAETKIRKAGSKAFGKMSGVITECLWKGNYV